LALLLLAPSVAAAEDQSQGPVPQPRGPIELRNEWLLSQDRLTLPATSPDTTPLGNTRIRLELDTGNDFGWRQDIGGEAPEDRRFLVDGEHRSLAVEVRHGVGRSVDLGARLPIHWRGGGFMDAIIDTFHDYTAALGVTNGGRHRFLRDQLRVLGRDEAFNEVVWGGGSGTGLGNLELSARWRFVGSGDPSAWSAGLVGRVALPTGTGTFGGSSLDAGAQLVAARGLGTKWNVYLGVGGLFYGDEERRGIHYSRWRTHGFVALEWRVSERWSLHLETSVSSRLVTNLAEYPGVQSYLRLGAQSGLGPWRLQGGFTENLVNQQATVDIGIFLGMTRQF